MNSGLISLYHNNIDNYIFEPEYSCQYWCWFLSGHKGTKNANNYHWVKKFTAGWIIKLLRDHRHQYLHLHHIYKLQCVNCKWQKISCKTFCTQNDKKYPKHISLYHYGKKTTKCNKSNSTQILQLIQNFQNWSANMVKNHNMCSKWNQGWNTSQRKIPAAIILHYNWDD